MSKVKLLAAGLIGAALFALPGVAAADVNDFTVTNFNSDETLSRTDRQGELHIVEHISVNFTDYNHGILRAIPDTYKHHSLQLHVNSVTSETGAATKYTTYGSNGNTVLKIGDANRTVTGPQEYTIDYSLRNVVSFYKDHTELYWNVNGNQWQQPFQRVRVVLHLPAGLQQTKQPLCYTGSYGGTGRDCMISTTGNTLMSTTTQTLQPNQTLTYVAGFATGYFQPSTWYQTLGEHLKPILECVLPILIIGGGSLLYWWSRGRDPKGTGIIVPQYDAPDGLKPAEVGTIIDFKLDNGDITATIIDLAIRGYIKIIESKQEKLLRKDTLSYSLQLVKPDFSQLDPNEKILMAALFSNPTAGALIDISTLKFKLSTTAKTLSTNVEASLTSAGYFHGNPLTASKRLTGLLVVVFLLIFFGGSTLGFAFLTGLIIGGGIAVICSFNLAARTIKGVTAKEHILGLKLYLNVAEKDRLAALQAPDAKYAANANEPVRTVELFEKLLPYAMVLGVEKQWSRQFESMYTSPPHWYSGNWSTFNAYYLVSSLNSGIGTAVDSAFSAPSSSGSSGFSGGFSGGGGGGGGGGGW
jgi:uncharacterized membrane protein